MNTTESASEFSFWKNLILVTFFFTLTPIALGASLFSLVSLTTYNAREAERTKEEVTTYHKSGARVFASLPTDLPSVDGYITSTDARAELVRQYLAYWGSPLEPCANLIVETADKYGLDYRLTTAIAQKESNLCKIIPPGSYNCWGWGIHSEGTLGFSSFAEGIEVVSKGLREEYLDKGYTTIEEIMSKYTPLSNGSWALGVSQFMAEME
ncbi:MAG: hypothetical protein ACOYT7_01190 [Patescibacteria group bacterium]